ncbi:MAG: dihydrolipoamide acetyltransferase family protein [Propioniciclava sp.]
MPEVVVMPQLGNTVESCLVTTWLVQVGDVVEPTTLLCEIETDKSAMEVPAGVSGTVLALLAEEGDEVPVKDPLVIVGEPGDDLAGLVPSGEAEESAPTQTPAEAPAPSQASAAPPAPEATPGRGSAVSPRARGLAASGGVAAENLAGTGPQGRVIERDVQAVIDAGPGLTAGALAAGGVVTPGVTGTGLGGRATRAEVTAPAAAPLGGLAAGDIAADFPGPFTDAPLKGIRKVVAERMMNALATSAQVSYTSSAPAAGILTLRKRLKGAADPELAAVTIGDLVSYATIRTLAQHPNVNAHLTGATLRTFEHVHFGMAVDTPRGLLVPTLRYADTLTLREVSVRSKALAAEALAGSISPDLLAGASFTVSNLGAFGMESFTPVINVPQVAILGVNAITPRPIVNADGSLGVEQRIGFSLTADHQVIDGADAARFLQDLCAAIADIDLTVLG